MIPGMLKMPADNWIPPKLTAAGFLLNLPVGVKVDASIVAKRVIGPEIVEKEIEETGEGEGEIEVEEEVEEEVETEEEIILEDATIVESWVILLVTAGMVLVEEVEEVGVVIVIDITRIVVRLDVAELPLREGDVEEVVVLGPVPQEEEVVVPRVEAREEEEDLEIVKLLLAHPTSVDPQGLLLLIESVIDLPRIGIDHPLVLL